MYIKTTLRLHLTLVRMAMVGNANHTDAGTSGRGKDTLLVRM